MTPQSFTIRVPDAVLADLRERLGRTRWPDAVPIRGVEYTWLHPLSAVLGGLIRAGLRIESFAEFELGEVVAGRKPGRRSPDEIVVFDSTGSGLQDAAAAVLTYEKAVLGRRGTWLALAE